ncbi:GumC domain-containing protein [Helicovermis profundi]|uniref:Polysaccharide chain length determinant N-terminal domain-containing protein n=1 Tax=Helicovermis profundi TaxID=3065157 RepID=A0AAU9E797_9FIRM|nr:hypothetical protein HLPR_26990 [Clostridia bacterium S502]
MENNQSYDEISLKELIMVLIKNKEFIIVFTLIAVLITGIISYNMNVNSKEAQLLFSINHAKISQGKNIDGSTFDVYEIASPYILKDVIKELKLEGKLSSNDIRKNIVFSPLIPESIEKKQKFSLEKEGTSLPYYPNQFLLEVKTDKSSGIDSSLAMKIANQIIESYIKYFSKEYIDTNPVVNKIIAFKPNDYDYSDVSMVFHNQIDTLVDYNTKLSKADPDYRSKNTGLSFSDIVSSIYIIDEIDLNHIDSMISAFKLTKDKKKLIVYYNYLIDQLQLNKNKVLNSENVTKTMLDKLDNTKNDIILNSNNDNNDNKDTKESYFSNLVLQTSSFGGTIADIQKNIDYYKNELNELNKDKVLDKSKVKVENEVENLIDSTFIEIQKWINITNKTSSEFYEKLMTRAVTPLSPAEIYSNVNVKLNLAIGIVLGLMISVFIAFFREYWKES